jgi:hypothetical protein
VAEEAHRSAQWLTRKWGFAAALATSPLFFVCIYFMGDPARGMVAWVTALSLVFAARQRWDRRAHVSFWMTLTVLVAIHTILILSIPWPRTKLSGYGMVPIFLAHHWLVRRVFGLVEQIQRRFSGQRT